eukprot:SAG11_NODE_552_length_8583_cov_3.699081_14_plen_154_part_00
MTPELRCALFQWLWTEGRDEKKTDCIPYQMQKLFVELQTSDRRDAETTGLTQSFGWTDAEAFDQHDVNELCDVLFDSMENSFRGTRGDGVIRDIFFGKQKVSPCIPIKHLHIIENILSPSLRTKLKSFLNSTRTTSDAQSVVTSLQKRLFSVG